MTEEEVKPEEAPSAALFDEFERLYRERVDPDSIAAEYARLHNEWMLRINYFVGNQSVKLDNEKNRIKQTDAPTWRSRYTANLVAAKVLRQLSKIAGEDTAARAAPAGPEREDVVRASRTDAMLDHVRYVSQFPNERLMAVLSSIIFGTGAIRTRFDFERGPRRAIVSADGEKKKVMPIGEVVAEHALPFGIRIPLHADREEYLPWLVYRSWRDVDEMRFRYPSMASRINALDVSGVVEFQAELKLRTLSQYGQGVSEAPARSRVCRVDEIWGRPTYGYPNGFHGILVNDMPIHVSVSNGKIDNPGVEYDHAIPFAFYRYLRVPGRFWGMGLVELVERIQSEYNRSRADMVENVRLMGRPKLLTPKGAIEKNKWTSEPGEVVEYNASAGVPTVAQPAQIPAWVVQHIETARLEMNEVSGQTEASEGKAPASIRSGVAIQLLQSAANETVGHSRLLVQRGDFDAYVGMLRIAQRFYTEERVIVTLGPDRGLASQLMKGSDIADPTSVRIFAETGLFESKAARQQAILDALQLGVFKTDDPSERLGLASSLQMGDVAPHLNEMLTHQRRADEEDAVFSRLDQELSAAPQVRDFHDHAVHIRRHNLFRNSARYDALSEDARRAIDDHVALHQQFLMQQVQAQMQMNESRRGGPGEKGNPSPPSSGKSGEAKTGD